MTRTAQRRFVDTTIGALRNTNLDELARQLRTAIDRDHPSTPDGYPTRTPGSDPGTTSPTLDEDGRVELTSVEAAVEARTHWRDDHHRHTLAAIRYLSEAVHALDACRSRLRLITNLAAPQPTHVADTDDWCSSCLRIHRCEPIYSDQLCRFCFNVRTATGRRPELPLLQKHHHGKRITTKDVTR